MNIELAADEALVDESIALTIPPETTLQANLIDDFGNHWQSVTCGEIKMDWVVTMKSKGVQSIYLKKSVDPTLISLKLLHHNKVVSERVFKQHYLCKGVTHEDRGEGRVYYPQGKHSHVGVVVLSGSGGGRPDTRAALLASRGFTAYALPYFRFGKLPRNLERIPLEYFEKEIEWFRKKVGLLALMGASKGGELALLLGSHLDIDKIVAYVPSCATYGGYPNFHLPAWSYKGKDLPIAPIIVTQMPASPIIATPFFLETLDRIEAAMIPVEQIRTRLLIISGSDDKMWPSKWFGDRIVERCPQAIHLSYEGAGHLIGPPYVPLTITTSINPLDGYLYEMGGKLWPHLRACEDSWRKILQFLKEPCVSSDFKLP